MIHDTYPLGQKRQGKFNAQCAGKHPSHDYLGFFGSRKSREPASSEGEALRGKKYSLVKNQFLGNIAIRDVVGRN